MIRSVCSNAARSIRGVWDERGRLLSRWPRSPRPVALPAVVVVSALAGCAHTLAPMRAPAPLPVCAADGDDCLARGRAAFEAYRQAKVSQIQDRSQGYRLPAAPVDFIHASRTAYSILLIHGLNDSAYYVADLGEALFRAGFNVVTILLPGHGTDTHDMLDATSEQWRNEVDTGLEMAQLVGRQVIVGGFSLGGALAIDAVLRHPETRGLLLFSPAIRLSHYESVAFLACAPGLRSLEMDPGLPMNPVKYKYRLGNGVCQLVRMMRYNLQEGDAEDAQAATDSERVRRLARRVTVPTFVAQSYADARVSPAAAMEFAASVSAPAMVATFGTAGEAADSPSGGAAKIWPVSSAGLPHSYLVRRSNPYNGQENPCFDRMVRGLTDFMADHFGSERVPAETPLPECRPIGDILKSSD